MTRVNPGLGPPGPKTSLKEKAIAVISGTGETVAVFALIMGGLLVGLFTPTEAGAAGAAGMLIVSLVRRKLSWHGFVAAVIETVRTSSMIFLIAAGATVLGHFLAVTRIPYTAASWASGLALPAPLVMVIIMVIYVIGGCFVDALALILLTIPILFPVSLALGFDPIWFGIIIVIVTEIALITPPVGINVYIIAGVAQDVPMSTVFRGILPFLVPLLLLIGLLMVFPEIALFLPRLLS
jgi:tripartite ATP-independent transporter DctM subunit